MSVTVNADGSLWIEEYSLVDLVLGIQKQVQRGYEISLTNHNYPQGFSGHFTVGMVVSEGIAAVVTGEVSPEAPAVVLEGIKPVEVQTPVVTAETPVAASEKPVGAPKKPSTRAAKATA